MILLKMMRKKCIQKAKVKIMRPQVYVLLDRCHLDCSHFTTVSSDDDSDDSETEESHTVYRDTGNDGAIAVIVTNNTFNYSLTNLFQPLMILQKTMRKNYI